MGSTSSSSLHSSSGGVEATSWRCIFHKIEAHYNLQIYLEGRGQVASKFCCVAKCGKVDATQVQEAFPS